MNSLQSYLATRHLRPERILNILQEAGVISDLCVSVEDVADADCERAVKWLEGKKEN